MRLIDVDEAIAAVEKVAGMFPDNAKWLDATSMVMGALEDLPAARTIDAVQMYERAIRGLEDGTLSVGEFEAKIRPLRSVTVTEVKA